MAAGDKWTVISSSGALLREEPSNVILEEAKILETIKSGTVITEISQRLDTGKRLWIETEITVWEGISKKTLKGWVCAYSGSLKYLEKETTETENTTTTTVQTITENSEPDNDEEDDDVTSGYQPDITDALLFANTEVDDSEFVKIKNVAGVFGLPYQFLPNTDLRLSSSEKSEDIGYEYAEKIIEKIPLLFIAPGKPSFMTKYSKTDRENILEYFLSNRSALDINKGSLEDLLSKNGRYYTFEYDTARYYKFVNPMCRIAARYLNIEDVKINHVTLDRMNWETFASSGISSIADIGTWKSIPFYLDSETSIGESYGNSTTQSSIASGISSLSDYGRELSFLMGMTGAITGVEALANDKDMRSQIENVTNTVNQLLGSGNFLSGLAKSVGSLAVGGKLIFPEIWSDSTFSRSYTCNFKFESPDPSNLSVYLNTLVPLFHLVGLVAPQTATDPNIYINPFIVRAMYKGFFNIDMGIITDMSITRGAECQWTKEGIPTSINVSITIKDLYNAMSITQTDSEDWKYDTLNNTALMDYIANLCGINVYKPEISRMIEMWYMNNFTNRVEDFFQVNIWGGIQDKVQNLIMNIYR